MRPFSLAAAVVSAVALVTPRAASAADLDPIRIGDLVVASFDGKPDGIAARLDVVAVEPLTVIVESFDTDVRVRVEDASGAILAEDDDSGVETNAHLVFTPAALGPCVVRVLGRDAARDAEARFCVLRGTIDPTPQDPRGAARDFWILARHASIRHGDAARRALASERLAALDGRADAAAVDAALAATDAAADDALAAFKRAEAAAAAGRSDEVRREVRTLVERLATADDAVAGDILFDVPYVAFPAGALDETRTALERYVAHARGIRLDAHPKLVWARANLAATLEALGDLPGALALHAESMAARENTVFPDEEGYLVGCANFAAAKRAAGDLDGARELQEKTLAVRERTRPADDPETVWAKGDLAATIAKMGDLRRARELETAVLEASERIYADDHPRLQAARSNLGETMRKQGELKAALDLQERALANLSKHLSSNHPSVQTARSNLALTRRELGDLAGARELLDAALAVLEATLPETHPNLQLSRSHVATVMYDMGDRPGAKALFEKVLAAEERTLRDDHPDLQLARMSVAHLMRDLGQLEESCALFEKVVSVYERRVTSDNPMFLGALENLAVARWLAGEFAAARETIEKVIDARTRTIGAEHADTLLSRGNLALVLAASGDLATARAIEADVLAARERTLDENHRDIALARYAVARSAAVGRDWNVAAAAASALGRGETRRLRFLETLSSREAAEGAARMERSLSRTLVLALALPPGLAAPLGRDVFAWTETRRAASTPAPGGPVAAGPEIAAARDAALAARRRVAELVARTSSPDAESRPDAEAVADAVRVRDREDARLRKILAERGAAGAVAIDVDAVAKALPKRSAAVAYLRYSRSSIDTDERREATTADHLLAHVVLPDGRLERVELGPTDAIVEAARGGRFEAGAPPSRGATIADAERDASLGGAALRERVLDPVLKAIGDGTTTLFVCPDDVLHLVPLDALPLGDGVVGDRFAIRTETSFARLVSGTRAVADDRTPPSILVVGGIDYDAGGASSSIDGLVAAAPPLSTQRGAGAEGAFAALRGTRDEAAAIADLFATAFGGKPEPLTGERATKAEFHERAPRARYVHLATHGYFASEGVKSRLDEDAAAERSWSRTSLEAAVTGLSPLALCGLALAGANRGMDALGRVPGILTAEELSGVDLSRCEIAVLSACETNVGLRRAGQGIASLQAALHAAGARTAITSLWKVDDERTRELMVDFYRRIWVEKKGKAEALWEAKRTLRAKGAPARDWAAWVLTGEPD